MFIFKNKKKIKEELINFSANKVSTGQVTSLIKYLYDEYEFYHIGYEFENGRFYLYTCYNNSNLKMKQYFKDRNSGMIEDLAKNMRPISCEHNLWENGFDEVVFK